MAQNEMIEVNFKIKIMKKLFLIQSLLGVITMTFLFSCGESNKEAEITNLSSNESLVKHGEYLVKIMGCNDCHSPKNMGPNGPEIDMARRLSGYPSSRVMPPIDTNVVKNGFILFIGDLTASVGPWGNSFAANITSDSATGIGKWTEDQFRRAILQGKFNGDKNGRMILPPMPWQEFSNLNDEDVTAIFAYLKSTNPVENKVPEPIAFKDLK